MQTSFFRLAAGLALTLLLTACPETHVADDFGSSPVKLKTADWEGSWHPADEADEVFTFHVRDAAQGLLELHEATPKGKTKKPEVFTLALRDSGIKSESKLLFAILKDSAKPENGTLYLLRRSDDDVFLLWAIDHDAVTTAIKSGELKGRVLPDKDGPHNSLASDPANYPKLLDPKFWKWTEPSVLVRQGSTR
ncbi:MAG: hypothetical protein IPK22_10600 [Verrucomicrobiaceae bacterium]|nr:hypothetical protein [Verrucomicrobiaceae bacterium]